jgi:hypothetical protein
VVLSEAEAVVVRLTKAEEGIELEETLSEEVLETSEEEGVVGMTDPLEVWLAEVNMELVELEKTLDEVELDMTAEVVLPKKVLDEAALAVLLVETTEDPVVVVLLARDSTIAKSVPGEATLLFLSIPLK